MNTPLHMSTEERVLGSLTSMRNAAPLYHLGTSFKPNPSRVIAITPAFVTLIKRIKISHQTLEVYVL